MIDALDMEAQFDAMRDGISPGYDHRDVIGPLPRRPKNERGPISPTTLTYTSAMVGKGRESPPRL